MRHAYALLMVGVLIFLHGSKIAAGAAPPMLRVAFNQLKSPSGQVVILQGINISSFEWSASGEKTSESAREAILNWNANVIRLPLSQDPWFGKLPGQTDGGISYRTKVRELITLATAQRAYVVLDLHWSNTGTWGQNMGQHEMPDMNSLAFWKSVAGEYANNTGVLFDLYNEPHDVTWELWRDGGNVAGTNTKNDKLEYKTPGMQAILDTVRDAGAKNIVIVGGLDWGYDLTGILDGFALKEKGGNGIMYSSHIYPWRRNWDEKVGRVAEQYPVFVGEVGCNADMEQESPYVWAPDAIAYIQKHKLHWTAWVLHPSSSPKLIQDWDFTPTPQWGAFAKAALLGVTFQSQRTR